MLRNESKAVVVRIWQEVVNEGKLNVIDDLVDESYTYRGPGGYELKGPEGFKLFITALHDMFNDLNVTIHEYIVEKDKVLSRWEGYGKYLETNREVRWQGVTITHVANGKMIDDWEFWDRLEIAEQIADSWLQKRIVDLVAKRSTQNLP